jgi:hypothetical protein
MARRQPEKAPLEEPQEASKKILRWIGSLDPYADANPNEVEKRLRNMAYGATNSRVSKLRRADSADGRGDE